MKSGTVILKRGKEKPINNHHHWIFSGAVAATDAEDGSIVTVTSADGTILGQGYYNSRSRIPVRMLTFGSALFTNDTLRTLITESLLRRKINPLIQNTNAVRLIFSEGDFLPGLIVDSYAGNLVFQCLTLGIDRMKPEITQILLDLTKTQSIYERSDYPGRSLEGIASSSGQLTGSTPEEILVSENGIKYPVNVKTGQKTGFFIDQRENRELIGLFARGKKVLNIFSYTGGFTFAAVKGGAKETLSVDISRDALEQAEKTYSLNGFTTPSEYLEADAFEYLRNEPIDSDLIIIDPPAFAKSSGDVEKACRGYKDINLHLIKKCSPGTILLTCSCSRFIDMDLFQKVIFAAASDAKKDLQIIRKTGHPADHPVNLNHPETEYLKGILLYIK
jgi:23S rRNA (cytosine1962-C5)-methyltransferase